MSTITTGINTTAPYCDPNWNGSLTYITWGLPTLLQTFIYEDRVEQIFKQECTLSTFFYPSSPRIYKEIHTIVNGKLLLTQTVEGTYVPPSGESYFFNE